MTLNAFWDIWTVGIGDISHLRGSGDLVILNTIQKFQRPPDRTTTTKSNNSKKNIEKWRNSRGFRSCIFCLNSSSVGGVIGENVDFSDFP